MLTTCEVQCLMACLHKITNLHLFEMGIIISISKMRENRGLVVSSSQGMGHANCFLNDTKHYWPLSLHWLWHWVAEKP